MTLSVTKASKITLEHTGAAELEGLIRKRIIGISAAFLLDKYAFLHKVFQITDGGVLRTFTHFGPFRGLQFTTEISVKQLVQHLDLTLIESHLAMV